MFFTSGRAAVMSAALLLHGLLAAASGNGLAGAATSLRSYVDPTFRFRVAYPEGFVVRSQGVSRLVHAPPRPVAAVYFMNPVMAAGALAGMEPPDLEVRVYEARTGQSVERWLVDMGFASSADVAAGRRHTANGIVSLRICGSTMLAPGCSIYVLSGNSVFQLTAGSVEGESMARTFSLER
jgi:hypothetical protein